MKKVSFFKLLLIGIAFFSLESCGPVVVTSRIGTPPPPWFYPHRAETVRYIYFPDYLIYYDLSLRNYIYFDNGTWLTVNVLPSKFNHINLRRTSQIRIKNYFGDNIRKYHYDNRNQTNKRNSNSVRRRN
ncbi:MAG: hypothetical protein R3342_05585 [Lutibacter sp.]|uniref:hypothetical protein n=1 Tax=Lutibacter sp. TaxID=1925666 RepID=UPI00299DC6F6|nr:hypothetical protein [Lutibacter sp.]MDX1829001.1 hypothetical protein [Lutibacter sp.]